MTNALHVMNDMAGSKKKIALLGYMPQLGDGEYAKQEYTRMGEKAIETRVDLLIVVGEDAKEIGKKAIELGMDPGKVYFTENGTEIHQIIHPHLNEEAIVLLKIPHRVMVQETFKELKEKLLFHEGGET
jgi:UDP-N-acetylmuramyl pentapeptide synthase